MNIRFDQHKEQESQDEDVLVATEREHEIILFNDDVNTFDHVIKTLVSQGFTPLLDHGANRLGASCDGVINRIT